jgi:dihydrofolate synthase / folylpolyglutamate synthase
MEKLVDLDAILLPWHRSGVKLGLDNIKEALAALGNPHLMVPVVHVGGTNGKGSTCAYLASVLGAAGYRVGRYTSPHLVDWNERICINGQPIATDRLTQIVHQIQNTATENALTKFELITTAAWLYFAQEQVDIAVMEVGLGGRLDATNVIEQPLVSVITSISREHWQQLGETIPEIATEKAGIIKSGCPVVIGQLPAAAVTVIQQKALALECALLQIEPAWAVGGIQEPKGLPPANPRTVTAYGVEYALPLLGDIQLHNSALAIATIQVLQKQGWKIELAAIQQGMAQTDWPGRLQWTTWQGQPLLMDGAHNEESAIALRRYVDTLQQPVTWVMGMLSTKEHFPILQALLRSTDAVHFVPVPDELTADPVELVAVARSIYPEISATAHFDWVTGLNAAYQGDFLVVMSGSLYLLGDLWRTIRTLNN